MTFLIFLNLRSRFLSRIVNSEINHQLAFNYLNEWKSIRIIECVSSFWGVQRAANKGGINGRLLIAWLAKERKDLPATKDTLVIV